MTRRHELDWLRVLLFALLVPHHVAVGFVDWGVDIYRFVNDQLAGDGMTLFIYWSHSWRLPSLFLIAGIGTYFLTTRGAGWPFIGQRFLRLGPPLVFGTLFLNVFGGYAIAFASQEASGFGAFFERWVTAPELRQIQHLWFLVNLMVYTLLCWPVFFFRDKIRQWMPAPVYVLATLVVLSAVAVVVLKPHAAALAGDNYQFVLYLLFFLGGYVIGADHARFLGWTARYAYWILTCAVVLFACKVILLSIALFEDISAGEALAEGGWKAEGLNPPNPGLFSIVEAATAWFWCVAALGLAVKYLNRPSSLLVELNRAVFPFYVLHFPITLIGLALATQFAFPWWLEFILLLVFVYGLTWMMWRMVSLLGPVSVLVGGKPMRRQRPQA